MIKQILVGMVLLLAATQTFADRFANVEVNAIPLGNNIYMLTGAGGNMALVVADGDNSLIDSQYAEMADKIKSKVAKLTGQKPLSNLINTHVHGDHVGGNAALAGNIRIIAHSSVRERLLQDSSFPASGLPNTTFSQQLNLQLSGNTLRLEYMPPSHTDGDIVVWFVDADIIHMGDLLFEGRFPFIDTSKGGSVKGYIANTRNLLSRLSATTKVIPGHGNLTDKAGVERSLQMMEATLAIVQGYKAAGMTQQQAVEKGLGATWKSWHWSFITEERWIKTLYHADVN